MQKSWIKLLYAGAGLYDGILGLAFLFFGRQLFEAFEVTPPNHYGYVQFPALLLIIFAVMFFQIAITIRHPRSFIALRISAVIRWRWPSGRLRPMLRSSCWPVCTSWRRPRSS